jgi:peptidoglycan hydrolase CwlO-like protein
MLKKLAWIGIIAFVGVVAVKATGFDKFCGPLTAKWKKQVEAKIPLETQIEAIKDQISKLQPDVEKAKETLATKRVAVKKLRDEVGTLHARLEEQKGALTARAEAMSDASAQYIYYGDRKLPVADAKKQLGRDLKIYEQAEALYKSKSNELQIREEELKGVQEQVEALIAARNQAETEVAQLESELVTLRLAETRSRYQADDSRLADIKQSMQKVRDRLNVAKEKLVIDAQYGTAVIPAETKDVGPDPVEAVRAKFAEKKDAAVAGTK